MVNQYPLPREKRETPELVGNGGAVYGPFGFKIFEREDVVVEVKRPGGAWQVKQVEVAKVSGAAAFDYFTIEFDKGVGADVAFRVKGKRLHERSTDLTRGGTIIVDEMERETSKQGVVLQEVRRDLDGLPALRDEVAQAVDMAAASALEAGLAAGAAEVARDGAVVARDAAQVARTAAEAAAAQAEAIAGFDPDTKLDKAGGTVTGDLTVGGNLSAANIYTKGQADEKFLPLAGGEIAGDLTVTGNLKGDDWLAWGSEAAKEAIEARIEERAQEIADEKINARCVTDTRFEGWSEWLIWIGTSGASGWSQMSGYVLTAARRGNMHQVNFGVRQLQVYIPDIGWRAFGSW